MVARVFTGQLQDFRPFITCRIAPFGADYGTGREVRALIDTGATDVNMRPELAEEIGAVIDGEVRSNNIGSSGMKRTCRVNITLTNDAGEYWTAYQARALIDQFDDSYDIILGMNVLRLVRLTVIDGVPEIAVKVNEEDRQAVA